MQFYIQQKSHIRHAIFHWEQNSGVENLFWMLLSKIFILKHHWASLEKHKRENPVPSNFSPHCCQSLKIDKRVFSFFSKRSVIRWKISQINWIKIINVACRFVVLSIIETLALLRLLTFSELFPCAKKITFNYDCQWKQSLRSQIFNE